VAKRQAAGWVAPQRMPVERHRWHRSLTAKTRFNLQPDDRAKRLKEYIAPVETFNFISRGQHPILSA
jgi:hypothetical protein